MFGQNVEDDKSEQGKEDKIGGFERHDVALRRHVFFSFLEIRSETKSTTATSLVDARGGYFFYRSSRVLASTNKNSNLGKTEGDF